MVAAAEQRGLRRLLMSAFVCALTCWLISAGAVANEFTDADYNVFEGDVDGDGVDDVYLQRVPDVVMLATTPSVPLLLAEDGSYLVQGIGTSGSPPTGYLAPVADDTVDVSSLSQIDDQDLVFGDLDGDGYTDVSINGLSIPETLVVAGAAVGELPARTLQITDDTVLALPNQTQTASLSGTTPYSAGVSSKGKAQIIVPIDLPPGVNELQPNLSLAYESMSQNIYTDTTNLLTGGWSLQGLGVISRCRNGVSGPAKISFGSFDQLCMNGERLIAISGSYWGTNTEYRLARNRDYKIISKGPDVFSRWFEVYAPDGKFMLFGNTPESRIDINGNVHGWSLTSVFDDYGNSMTIDYEEDKAAGTNFPTGISYGGVTVSLDYQMRTDVPEVDAGTTSIRRTVSINSISVAVYGQSVRDYLVVDQEFVYVPGPPAPLKKNRLPTALQLCGYDTSGSVRECQAPLTLDWEHLLTGSRYVVKRFTDGRGAKTEFDYAHVSSPNINPAGPVDLRSDPNCPATYCDYHSSGPTNPNLEFLPGIGRWVVSEKRMSDGMGGMAKTSYQYDGAILMDRFNWGFAGFPATSITQHDVPYMTASRSVVMHDVTTYRKHRLDLQNRGAVAASRVHSSIAGLISEREVGFGVQTHPLNVSIQRGTLTHSSSWSYQSGQVVSAKSDVVTNCFKALSGNNCGTQNSEFATFVEQTASTGTGLTSPSFTPSIWAEVPVRSVVGEIQTQTKRVDFLNDPSNWVIGFVSETTATLAAPGQPTVTRDSQRTRDGQTSKLKTLTLFPGDSDLERITTLTIDSMGNPTSVSTSGAQFATRATSFGNFLDNRYPQLTSDALNGQFTASYDVRHGRSTNVVDPEGLATSQTFDELGRITSTTGADGTVSTVTFDDCSSGCGQITWGNPSEKITTTVFNGSTQVSPTSVLYLDELGREVLSETQAFDSADGWVAIETHYDQRGRIEKVSTPYHTIGGTPNYTTHGYDPLGRTTRVTNPDGGYTTNNYSVSSNQLVATSTNRVITPDAPGGSQTEDQVAIATFNALSQLITSVEASGTSEQVTTTYSYDAAGNLDKVTVDGTEVANMDYDAAGNRKVLTGPNLGTATFEFNGLGQLHSSTNADNQTTSFLYDLLGRIIERVDDDGGALETTNTWNWDAPNAYGALQSRTTQYFSENYTYDSSGRLSTATTGVSVPGWPGNSSYAVSYDYLNGRLDDVTYPSSLVVGYGYNARGYLTQRLDGSSVLDEVDAVDAFGVISEQSFGNGLRTSRNVDSQSGRITAIETGTVSAPSSIQDLEYKWRTNSALYQRVDLQGVGTSDDLEETFAYDALNRLTDADSALPAANRNKDYGYDGYGNLTSKTSSVAGDLDVTSYQFSNAAKPHQLTQANIGGITTNFVYDGRGNITHYDAASGDDTFIDYDAADNVSEIVVGASQSTPTPTAKDEFWYGPDGARFLRKSSWDDGGTQKESWVLYLLGGAFTDIRPVHDTSVDYYQRTQVTAEVLHRLKKPAGASATEVFEYTHRDHLGSVVAITNSVGAVIQDLAHDPFGGRKEADWSADISVAALNVILDGIEQNTDRGFTDHEMLDRTGFVHMNGRVFDPRLGRFVQPDPFVPSVHLGQSFNRYAYVLNSPVTLIDPSGYFEGPTKGGYFGPWGGFGRPIILDFHEKFEVAVQDRYNTFTDRLSQSETARDLFAIHEVRRGIMGQDPLVHELRQLQQEFQHIAQFFPTPPFSADPSDILVSGAETFALLRSDLPTGAKVGEVGILMMSVWVTARMRIGAAPRAGSVGAMRRLDFVASPKHTRKSRSGSKGAIGAGPKDGQHALDVSVAVNPTTTRRVGVDRDNGEIVVFDQTSHGVFHGHVRTFSELTNEMKSALIRSGMVDRKGNFR